LIPKAFTGLGNHSIFPPAAKLELKLERD
jgi:hypothetical protein